MDLELTPEERLEAFGEFRPDDCPLDAAERHRQHVTQWFSECTQMHRSLGEMDVADPRFTATIDAIAPGLAACTRDPRAPNATRVVAGGIGSAS